MGSDDRAAQPLLSGRAASATSPSENSTVDTMDNALSASAATTGSVVVAIPPSAPSAPAAIQSQPTHAPMPTASRTPSAAPTPAKPESRAPKRTTKTSQKLTVFPFAEASADRSGSSAIPSLPHVSAKTIEEEWLSRLEKKWLPRCTAYCTANSYDFPKLLTFLRNRAVTHKTDAKKFDEVIHTPYVVPEQQIGAARSTWLNDQYILDYINSVPGSIEHLQALLRQRKKTSHLYYSTRQPPPPASERFNLAAKFGKPTAKGGVGSAWPNPNKHKFSPLRGEPGTGSNGSGVGPNGGSGIGTGGPVEHDDSFVNLDEEEAITLQGLENFFEQNVDANGEKLPTTIPHSQLAKRIAPVGECLFFDYGVVVMWGLTWEEEQIVLKDIEQFEEQKLSSDDIEVEEFHFHYNISYHPRIYNDIITLKNPQNYMIRLTISHAIAQSVKLVLFEGLVDDTIDSMKHIPLILAETGKIQMTRKQVNRKIAQLFIMRINVNLVSNVLDTPEIFWSEPALEPLYMAIRGYLEIPQRVDVLNQRVTVISDMLDMLKENQTNTHGEQLEWIVIILIGIEIVIGVATTSIDLMSYLSGSTV